MNLSKTRAVLRNISRYIKAHGPKSGAPEHSIVPAEKRRLAKSGRQTSPVLFVADDSGASVNQLQGLPPLPKPHFATNSGIGAKDLGSAGRMALWSEFARIAHSLPIR